MGAVGMEMQLPIRQGSCDLTIGALVRDEDDAALGQTVPIGMARMIGGGDVIRIRLAEEPGEADVVVGLEAGRGQDHHGVVDEQIAQQIRMGLHISIVQIEA